MARSRKHSGHPAEAQAAAGKGVDGLPALESGGFHRTIYEEYAVLAVDPDTRLVGWNAAAERIFGYARSEVLGKPLSALVPAEASREGRVEDWLARAAATGRSEGERWLVRKNGTHFWASGVAVGVRETEGGIQGCIVVLRDMTDQKLALEQSREGEATFRLLLDSLPEGIFGVDSEGKCIFANLRCLEMLGYADPGEILGKDMHGILRPGRPGGAHVPEEAWPLRAAFEDIRLQGEAVFRRRDGSSLPVEFHAYPMRRGGERIGAAIAFLDVTQLQRAEAVRQADEEKSMQARNLESIARLAGGVAHEFNNALTAVSGFSELLLDRVPPGDPMRGIIEEIRKGGQRLAALTQQLLSFGRRQMLQARNLDMNAFLRGTAAKIQAELGKNIRLSLELDPELAPVRIDPDRFEKMLLDLARNAKASISGPGRMLLATRPADLREPRAARPYSVAPGIYACLSLRDTRADMPKEIVNRLFEPYGGIQFQANEPAGLTLASAYGFIRQSGGDFLVQAGAGQGIHFEIYLPGFAAEAATAAPTAD